MKIGKLLYGLLCGGMTLGMAACTSAVTTAGDVKTELEPLALSETPGVTLVDHSSHMAMPKEAEEFVKAHASDMLTFITPANIHMNPNENPTLPRIMAIKRAQLAARKEFLQGMEQRLKKILTDFHAGKVDGLTPLDRYLIVEVKAVMAPADRVGDLSDSELRKILTQRGIGTPRFDEDCKALSRYFLIGFSGEKVFLEDREALLLSVFSPAKFDFAKQLWFKKPATKEEYKIRRTRCSFKNIKVPHSVLGQSFATLNDKPMIVAFGQGSALTGSRTSISNSATKARLEALAILKEAYADAVIAKEMAAFLKRTPQAGQFDTLIAELEKRCGTMMIRGTVELASATYKLDSGWYFTLKMYGWIPENN